MDSLTLVNGLAQHRLIVNDTVQKTAELPPEVVSSQAFVFEQSATLVFLLFKM